MKKLLLTVGFGLLCSAGSAWAQAGAPQTPGTPVPPPATAPQNAANIERLADFVSKSTGPYTRIADGAWVKTYNGSNLSTISVRIATAQDGLFFFVTLVPRDKLVLSRNLLLKIAEMNASYDYAKLALDANALHIRIDSHIGLVDLAGFRALERQAATVADEAYGIIRDFLP